MKQSVQVKGRDLPEVRPAPPRDIKVGGYVLCIDVSGFTKFASKEIVTARSRDVPKAASDPDARQSAPSCAL